MEKRKYKGHIIFKYWGDVVDAINNGKELDIAYNTLISNRGSLDSLNNFHFFKGDCLKEPLEKFLKKYPDMLEYFI